MEIPDKNWALPENWGFVDPRQNKRSEIRIFDSMKIRKSWFFYLARSVLVLCNPVSEKPLRIL